jgi:dihydrofolate reductase
MPPRISVIAALARNGVIGRGGALPWRLSSDLRRFRALTMSHPIIMGRKTYESIARALPGRKNIIVSRDPSFAALGCMSATSLTGALALAREASEIFIIGGAALYRDALPLTQRLYLTELAADVDGDTFFPPLDKTHWRELSREHVPAGPNNELPSDFVVYDRVVASEPLTFTETRR